MNKKILLIGIALVAGLLAATVLIGSGQTANALSAELGRGGQGGRGGAGLAWQEPAPAGTLTQAEIDGLVYMREEEKLAHDVYIALGEKWDLAILENIAKAEQSHTDAVLNLLERYGVADPAAGKAAGEFANAELQALYDELVEQGSRSLADALRVGGAIEEIDLLDLEERIAQTQRTDIQRVYENLMRGTRNHLRSFVSTLKTETGETYEPQQLSQEAYEEIVDGEMERGGGYGRGRGRGGNNSDQGSSPDSGGRGRNRGGGRGRNR